MELGRLSSVTRRNILLFCYKFFSFLQKTLDKYLANKYPTFVPSHSFTYCGPGFVPNKRQFGFFTSVHTLVFVRVNTHHPSLPILCSELYTSKAHSRINPLYNTFGCIIVGSYRPMRSKARRLVQHGGLPGWLKESGSAGCDFVRDERSMPPALTDHDTCPGLGLISY